MTRPSVAAILGQLAEAGPAGVLVSDLVVSFTEPDRARRNRMVNVILASHRVKGRVRRSDESERSPYYHHVPCFRWYITPAGIAHMQRGPSATGEYQARMQLARERSAAAVAQARDQGLGPGTSRRVRDAMVHELTAAGVSARSIGELFGITRQRVTQIARQ